MCSTGHRQKCKTTNILQSKTVREINRNPQMSATTSDIKVRLMFVCSVLKNNNKKTFTVKHSGGNIILCSCFAAYFTENVVWVYGGHKTKTLCWHHKGALKSNLLQGLASDKTTNMNLCSSKKFWRIPVVMVLEGGPHTDPDPDPFETLQELKVHVDAQKSQVWWAGTTSVEEFNSINYTLLITKGSLQIAV